MKNIKYSFYNWCIDNDRNDLIERWDNTVDINSVSYGSPKEYLFKCPLGIHESEPIKLNSITNKNTEGRNNTNCNTCNTFKAWVLRTFGEEFFSKWWHYSNTADHSKLHIQENFIKVRIICQNTDYHGFYEITPANFYKGKRCPYCANQKINIFDSLGYLYPESLKLWSNTNENTPYEFAPKSGKKVWWKCLDGKHKDYYRNPRDAVRSEFRCPECVYEDVINQISFLQKSVSTYLDELKYIVLHEDKCSLLPENIVNHKNMKRKRKLKYDNEVLLKFNKSLFIEVNGKHHYEINLLTKKVAKQYKTTPEYALWYQQAKDKYKRDYVLEHGHFYLELPYWTLKDEQYKKMINEKIDECNNILGVLYGIN